MAQKKGKTWKEERVNEGGIWGEGRVGAEAGGEKGEKEVDT